MIFLKRIRIFNLHRMKTMNCLKNIWGMKMIIKNQMITIMKIMVMRRIIRWVIRKKKLILIKTKVMLKAIWQTNKMWTNFKLKITTLKNIDKILNNNNIKIHNLIYNNKTIKTQISILTHNNLINNRISTHTHKINTTRISKILMTPTNKPSNQLIVTI